MPMPLRFPAGMARRPPRQRERNRLLQFPARQIFVSFLLMAACAGPTVAQSLDGATVDSIVGSDVRQDETTAAAMKDKVLAAIDKTAQNTSLVRKTSNVDQVDIVFLSDTARSEGGPPQAIADTVKAHESEITELRQEIEANALLYHAIDSRRVLVNDILAVDFEQPKKIIVYAAAKPAG